jgi:hypothetical protein
MSSERPAPSSSTLSREEAERYARRFVPVWQSSTGEPTAEIAIRDIPPPEDLRDMSDIMDAPVDLDGVLRRSVSPWVWVAGTLFVIAGAWAVKSALRPASEYVKSPSASKPVSESASGSVTNSAERGDHNQAPMGTRDGVPQPSGLDHPQAQSAESVPATVKSTVRIEVDPPEARLLLDDAAVNTPFEGELSLGSVHRVRAEAEGFQPKQLQFVVTENRVVRLWLTRMAASAASAVPANTELNADSSAGSAQPADRAPAATTDPTAADMPDKLDKPDKPARNRSRDGAERVKPAPRVANRAANKPAKRPAPTPAAPARPAGAGFVTDNPY